MDFFSIKSYTFSSTIVFLFLITTIPQSFSSSSSSSSIPTIYEILSDHEFPIGLLPKGVLDYNLDTKTGEFSAFLNGSCIFSVEGSYQLRYNKIIKGYISKGRLARLEGVSVKVLFFWVDIVEVLRIGDDLEFLARIGGGARFPIDNFEECPQCGCGLNCADHGEVEQI